VAQGYLKGGWQGAYDAVNDHLQAIQSAQEDQTTRNLTQTLPDSSNPEKKMP